MKKIISVVLALTMIMMLGVSSFAAISGPDADGTAETKTSDVQVKTIFKDEVDYETYEVTIPASIDIEWKAPNADDGKADYQVTTQLKTGAKISVSVADKTTGTAAGTLTKTGVTQSLAYTLTGGASADFGELITTAQNHEAKVTVTDWTTAPVDEYTGYLTYTVSYTAPTTTP